MSKRASLLKKGAWYYFFFSIIFLLIGVKYFKYFPEIDGAITYSYLTIATISHFIGLSFIMFLALYLPIILIFPHKKLAWIWAGISSSLGTALLYLDSTVFQLYRFHINSFVLELLFGGGATQIFQFSALQYIIIVGSIILLFALMLFLANRSFILQERYKLKGGKWIIATVAIMMFSSHFIHAWADAANFTNITKSSRYYPLYFPTTAKDLMLKIGLVDKLAENTNISLEDGENKDLNYPKQPLDISTDSKTNIVLILIDSWYYKAFDSITQPNLYKFSKKCEVFKHHYSGSNGTRTGVFSLFYSIPGTYWDDVLASQTGSIMVDALLMNNYDIKTFASATLANPPFDRTVFRKAQNIQVETKGESVCDRDNRITKDWLSTTKNHNGKQALFGFLFYDALHAYTHPANSHAPFQPAWDYPKYEQLNNDTDPTPMLNLYKNAAIYVDSLVGVVLSDLEQKGLLKNSWVIITGDHGQEFNDNKKNFWGHNGNYTDAQMQIPLLIYKPGGKHKEYTHWTNHYDIVPTLFSEIFNCKNPSSDYSVGRSLYDTTPRDHMLVGSKDNFAILESNRITSVYFDGSYDITDKHLNEIPNATLNTKLINDIMLNSKKYYK